MMATRGLGIAVGAIYMSWVVGLAYGGGVPAPGITLYGQVFAEDGSLRTSGRLTWTLIGGGDAVPVQVRVSTDLVPLPDSSGTTFSYRIHIPAEAPLDGMVIAPNYLPVTSGPAIYQREATLDGAFTWIMNAPTTTTFGLAERGKMERVDLLLGIYGPPGVPASPSPADGEMLVPLDITLDWEDTARTETYDLYLWPTLYGKPTMPSASGLTASQFRFAAPLRPDTEYAWQVVARNRNSTMAGAQWTFRTAYQGDIQSLLEFLLGKRTLSFQEQSSFDLNHDGKLDVADLLLGLKISAVSLGKPSETSLSGHLSSEAVVGERTVAIGTDWTEPNQTVPVALATGIVPITDGIAGVNLTVEADSEIVQFVGVRPGRVNGGEEIYSHSPYPGVMNVVFFAHPVTALQASPPCVLWLDLRVNSPHPGMSTPIYLKKAALSDVDGVSAANVKRSDGLIYTPGSFTVSRNWELYR
jgi:hypothetical protein